MIIILAMIIETLPIIEKDLARLSASDNLTSSLARTMIFYQIFLGKREGQKDSSKDQEISFDQENRITLFVNCINYKKEAYLSVLETSGQ
jgi:hypothetical protein